MHVLARHLLLSQSGDETMPRDKSGCSNLCYVASRQLTAPLMDRLDVWTTEGQRIGAFDGVVMDADEQRARYLVVDRGRFRPNR